MVIPGITLARQVNVVALHIKRLHELRVKTDEFFGEFFFILDVHFALGIADSDGLFHPHDIGQISPVVRIGGWTWVNMISETCIFSFHHHAAYLRSLLATETVHFPITSQSTSCSPDLH